MLYHIGKIIFFPFLTVLLRPEIRNRKGLKVKGPVIYALNHFSMGDPILLGTFGPREVWFLAKESLFAHRWQRLLWKLMHVTPASENGNSIAAVKKAVAFLESGKAFGIFPEGHRCEDKDEMDEIEKGCAFIALKSAAPIVPVYFDPMVWHTLKLYGAVGEPIYPEKYAEIKGAKPVDVLTRSLAAALNGLRQETEQLKKEKGRA